MGGSAPAKTTQTNKVELSPEQQKVFNLALPSIEQAAAQDPQIYGGSAVAGFNPTEIAAQQAILGAAGGTVNQLAGAGAAANQFMLDPAMMLSPDQNPYVTGYGDTIVRQLTQNLQQQILPGLNRQSEVTQGPYGSTSRLGIAQGNAIGQTAQAGGDALSKLYADAYGSGLEAMGRGLALNPQTIASQLTSGQAMDAVGGQQRAMEQALLDEQVNKFYLQQQLPFMKAQDLMALITGMPGGQGVSTVKGAQPQSGGLMAGLGGAASGAVLGSMIFPGVGTAVGAGLGGLLGLFS